LKIIIVTFHTRFNNFLPYSCDISHKIQPFFAIFQWHFTQHFINFNIFPTLSFLFYRNMLKLMKCCVKCHWNMAKNGWILCEMSQEYGKKLLNLVWNVTIIIFKYFECGSIIYLERLVIFYFFLTWTCFYSAEIILIRP
jgi:hypothetical protein